MDACRELTPQGKERQEKLETRAKAAANPEDLTTWDRCILGFNAGPPMIGGGYNAYIQLVQTSDHVVVLNEMVHDARIIPVNRSSAFPAHLRQWKGDSRGRWDGDTLVVETTRFRSEGTGTLSLRGLGTSVDENLRLTERFRRLDADTLVYEYTIDDPTVWTRPWTVSLTMKREIIRSTSTPATRRTTPSGASSAARAPRSGSRPRNRQRAGRSKPARRRTPVERGRQGRHESARVTAREPAEFRRSCEGARTGSAASAPRPRHLQTSFSSGDDTPCVA